MKVLDTSINELKIIRPLLFKDERGEFIKSYQQSAFKQLGNLTTNWSEEYFSISKIGVLRGMHFQIPPHDHEKLVTCIHGKVLDVVVDLRKKSSTYNQVASFELSEENKMMLFIPRGCAHGFLSLQDNTTMFYKVSSEYSADHDKGILWSSINFKWPIKELIISERDRKHPKLKDFQTPF
jgi:dTDP-4-dehydrorhamnose 3,5-epimerase